MAWELVYSLSFLATALIFAYLAVNTKEEPGDGETGFKTQAYRFLFLSVSLFTLAVFLSSAGILAQGNLETVSTVNQYVNVTVNETTYNATGYYLGSTIKQYPALNTTVTTTNSTNQGVATLAETQGAVIQWVILTIVAFFIIALVYSILSKMNELYTRKDRDRLK